MNQRRSFLKTIAALLGLSVAPVLPSVGKQADLSGLADEIKQVAKTTGNIRSGDWVAVGEYGPEKWQPSNAGGKILPIGRCKNTHGDGKCATCDVEFHVVYVNPKGRAVSQAPTVR